ncbi:MAG: VCBS repeat-containing protein [Acidobacteria bacterium]|nr:VCBS repeat-containing protein [Acidobacteriota bacterium]
MRPLILLYLIALATTPFPHLLHNAPTPEKHLNETMPGGIASLDYDNDSLPDLFFTNAAQPSRLYRNLGNNQWQDVTHRLVHLGWLLRLRPRRRPRHFHRQLRPI